MDVYQSLQATIASSVLLKKPLKIDKEKIPNQRQILIRKPIMLFLDTTVCVSVKWNFY
jgi:hypothetical protein